MYNCGRIELSALNSAFYARDCTLALSAPPDGDIINVNCTNRIVIVRDVILSPSFLPLSFSLSLSLRLSPFLSFFFSHIVLPFASRVSRRVLDLAFSFFPRPRYPISSLRRSAPFSSPAVRERLHLHLNLAVDLAVVRDHHSCRAGKVDFSIFRLAGRDVYGLLSRSTFSDYQER